MRGTHGCNRIRYELGMNSLISVIVPVYKVEKYLPQCVDSILAQTYRNLEIILVDDGSPDGCPKICDEYAKKDNRVRVIHQKNAGVSAARNAGLDAPKGNISALWTEMTGLTQLCLKGFWLC